jgi:hypothetical protein
MAVPGWIVIKARVWFFAVARGTSMPCNAGRRAATGATPTIGTTTSSCQALQQFCKRFFGVAKKQNHIGLLVKGIVHTRITGSGIQVAYDNPTGFMSI